MYFFSQDDKPEFQNIKEYCAVFLYDKQIKQAEKNHPFTSIKKKNASSYPM